MAFKHQTRRCVWAWVCGGAILAGIAGLVPAVVSAADLDTINNTESYADPANAALFIPVFLDSCDAAPDGVSAIGCAAHGDLMVSSAAGLEATPYFGDSGIVPQAFVGGLGPMEDGWIMILNNPEFSNGLFDRNADGYWAPLLSLYDPWFPAKALIQSEPFFPFTAPADSLACIPPGDCGPDATTRWVDQVVVGYIQSLDNLGQETLVQNMSSQTSFDRAPTSGQLAAYVDQRIEQSVALQMAAFEAERQTFQSAIAASQVDVLEGIVVDEDTVRGSQGGIGQLVSQDIEGYLFTCLDCDTPELLGSGGTHVFEPTHQDVFFIPYWSNWHSVPTITHAPVQ